MKSHEAAEATAIVITSQLTKASGITSAVAWLADTGYVAIAGLCLAALSLMLNLYFQFKRDRREHREYERRMWLMKTKPDHKELNDEAD
jgi:hypothetical protein